MIGLVVCIIIACLIGKIGFLASLALFIVGLSIACAIFDKYENPITKIELLKPVKKILDPNSSEYLQKYMPK